jgi:hypothetical protein
MKRRDVSQILNPGLAESLSEIAEKYGLHNRKTDSLIRSASLRPDDKRRIEAFARLNSKKIAKCDDINIPIHPPSEDADISGEILLGHDLYYGMPVGINLSELIRPMGVFGGTGGYKTLTLYNIAHQLLEKNIPVIIFDLKGGQYRGLQRDFPGRVLVLKTDGELALCPAMSPEGVDRDDYIPSMVEIRSVVYERHDSSNIYQEILMKEFEKCEKGCAPSEQQIHNAIIEARFRKGLTGELRKKQESQLTVSTGIVNSSFGKTLSYKRGLALEEIYKRRLGLVVECRNLNFKNYVYLITHFVNFFYKYLRSLGVERDKLRLEFIIDEGSRVFSDSKESLMLVDLSTRTRDGGIGITTGLHAPHLTSSMFRANLYISCCYRIASDQSLDVIQDMLFIDKKQREYVGTQPVGFGTLFLSDRYPKALAYEALEPKESLDFNIPDEEVKNNDDEIVKTFPSAIPWKGEILTVTIPYDDEFDFIPIKADGESDTAKEMTDKERIFLDYVLHRFDLPLTEVYRERGFSMEEGNQISGSVIKKNLVVGVWLNPSGKKGGLSKFLSHTQKFFSITGSEKPITGTDGKGHEHFLMLRFIVKNLKEVKNCSEVHISRAFENAVCDVFFRYKGLAYIAEVCCSTAKSEPRKITHILNNSDVEMAFVIVKEKSEVDEVKKEFVNSEIEESVVVCAFSEFLNSDIETLTKRENGFFGNQPLGMSRNEEKPQ